MGSIAFRTESIRVLGGFDETIRYGEDKDLQVRLAANYSVIGVADADGGRDRPLMAPPDAGSIMRPGTGGLW